MKLKALVAGLVFAVAGQAFGGLLIDPYLGAGKNAYVVEWDNTSVQALFGSDDTTDYTSVGSRLGYSFLLFSAGIDYEILTADDTDNTKVNNTSLFVGVDLPILLRAWAEYYLSSNIDSDGLNDIEFKDGYSIGVGFTGLPFVSINLELQNINYDTDLTISNVNYKGTIKYAQTLLSVSLPLDF